jgi:mono/diheme cytochrome c family protein
VILWSACAHPPPVPAAPPPEVPLEQRDISGLPAEEQRAILLELGERVYTTGAGGIPCVTCHQADGKGILGAFPPLLPDRPWASDCALAVQLVRSGVSGIVDIGGQRYNGVMPPGIAAGWTPLQVSGVVTYARSLAGAPGLCLP